MTIPARFDPCPLVESEREGWLAWSLPFFTDVTHPQNPHLSITLTLNVTRALQHHQAGNHEVSFFAWLAWSLLQVMADHSAFLLRRVEEEWWQIRNPPLVVPVAVGGRQRFVELVLEDVIGESWPDFAERYSRRLNALRAGDVQRADWVAYNLGVLVGSLPNLPFTGFSLHSHGGDAAGRCVFYFGARCERDGETTMPLAVQLHHATTDPYVLDQLLRDWRHRYLEAASDP